MPIMLACMIIAMKDQCKSHVIISWQAIYLDLLVAIVTFIKQIGAVTKQKWLLYEGSH